MNIKDGSGGSNEIEPRVVIIGVHRSTFKNYNYLVIDPQSNSAVLVDPAWQLEKIDEAVADAKTTVTGILITHSHPDHVDLAETIAKNRRCPIWMSKEERVASSFEAEQLILVDTKPLRAGSMLIEPILTPGHTPGSTCFLIGNNLFSGDVLFAEGCGICPDRASAYSMFHSLELLKVRLAPHTRIFPGHSYGKAPGQSFSQIRKENIYLQFSDPKSFAAFRLRSGQNLTKMFSFK